jgi:hypothetical protein
MAVTECKIQYATQTLTGNYRGRETIPVEWLITCDSRTDGPATIKQQARTVGPEPLPNYGQSYSVGSDNSEFFFVSDIVLSRVPGSDRLWKAMVTYDNTIDGTQAGENPLLRPAVDEWDFEQFQRLVFKDIDGNNIENSAGTALKLYADDSRPILTYTRNEANYPSQILEYQDAINSDPFLVFPAYTAKVNIRAGKRFENGIRFYETKYTFNFRYDTWRPEIVNEGNQFKVNSASTTGTFTWPNGYVGLLDDDGEPLGTGDDPTFKEFKIYRELPFAPLNIVIY